MVRPVYDESLIPHYEEQPSISAKAKSSSFSISRFRVISDINGIIRGFLFWMRELARYEEESLEDETQDQ